MNQIYFWVNVMDLTQHATITRHTFTQPCFFLFFKIFSKFFSINEDTTLCTIIYTLIKYSANILLLGGNRDLD